MLHIKLEKLYHLTKAKFSVDDDSERVLAGVCFKFVTTFDGLLHIGKVIIRDLEAHPKQYITNLLKAGAEDQFESLEKY